MSDEVIEKRDVFSRLRNMWRGQEANRAHGEELARQHAEEARRLRAEAEAKDLAERDAQLAAREAAEAADREERRPRTLAELAADAKHAAQAVKIATTVHKSAADKLAAATRAEGEARTALTLAESQLAERRADVERLTGAPAKAAQDVAAGRAQPGAVESALASLDAAKRGLEAATAVAAAFADALAPQTTAKADAIAGEREAARTLAAERIADARARAAAAALPLVARLRDELGPAMRAYRDALESARPLYERRRVHRPGSLFVETIDELDEVTPARLDVESAITAAIHAAISK
jgi:hypothetical protein